MITPEIKDGYMVTVGVECHVQLKTVTKLFAAVGNDAREAPPNTLISHICLGMPGALPVLNEQAVKLSIRAAYALNTEPQHFSKFDRKHYFYPDLPKGYQITQFDQPIILGGFVQIVTSKGAKRINVTRAHLEEDAGKSTHLAGKDYSLVDLNRAGTPLLEIVSEPDMHTAEEAKAYAHELWLLMRYADVSDANLYYGNMRFDVNVSVSKTKELGTRSETKNLNSFKSVERAVDYETERQISLLEKGHPVVQETRGWDDAKQRTFSQRTKEDAQDYRYFPDPDLPPVVIEPETASQTKATMPVMPTELRNKLSGLGLDVSIIETLVEEMVAGRFIIKILESGCDDAIVKRIANWLTSEIQALVAAEKITWESARLDIVQITKLSQLTADNKISSTGAKTVLIELVTKGGNVLTIAETKNVLQVSDENEISLIVKKVLTDNPVAASDFKSGESKAMGFLVGQVMKQSKGKANPQLTQKLIKQQLN